MFTDPDECEISTSELMKYAFPEELITVGMPQFVLQYFIPQTQTKQLVGWDAYEKPQNEF